MKITNKSPYNYSSNEGYLQSTTPSAAHVKEASNRFITVNESRIARLREGLQVRQQQCFDILPLLFHVNHEALPGYSAHFDIPFGIAHYRPSDIIIRLAQVLTKGRVTGSMLPTKANLSALYLMGSSGSIGQSTSSDLDIWVCFEDGLSEYQINSLKEKTVAISNWANDFNLEVHFFLMNARNFQGGAQQSLTGENCGSTQHVLLLDEFYRTVQILAGNIPAWWLIPSSHEHNYEQEIQIFYDQNYISEKSSTDFGGISNLPPSEFIGAGMWQVYKAIDSPYKSVLKLILLEIYARQSPKMNSLAHDFKDAIYENNLSLDDLDPYVMLYRKIEGYLLARGETDRLDLIRRCFYFKVSLNLSKSVKTLNWRRQIMDYLVSSWGWTSTTVKHLDNFRHWSIDQVISERKFLISELTNSYRFLTEFAAEHQSGHIMSQRDLLILSRKLHAAFDRRSGKIDLIKIGLDVDLSQEKIRIYERESKQQPGVFLWAAYNQPIDSEVKPAPLKYSKGLLETLLWSHMNGLISAHLHIPVHSKNQIIGDFEIRMTLASMRQYIPIPLPTIKSSSFYHPANIVKVVVFVNLGRDPLEYLSSKGLQKISGRSNSLDFSALRENLILTLDMVLINNWGEVVVERFTDNPVANALMLLINKINRQTRSGLPTIHAVCHNQTRPQSIAKRVQELFEDSLNSLCSTKNPKNTRFVFNKGSNFVLFQHANKVTRFIEFPTNSELESHLAVEQEDFSPVKFDRQCIQEQSLTALMYNTHLPASISIFYEIFSKKIDIKIIDEKGSFVKISSPYFNLSTLLSPLIRFLKVTEHRQNNNQEFQANLPRQIQCFVVERNSDGIALVKKKLASIVNEGKYFSVQVSVDTNELGGHEYQITCNEKEFNSIELGDNLYNAIASYILGLRASGKRYPSFITDLLISESIITGFPYGSGQTSHYLNLKLKLEARINDAMKRL